MKKLLTVILICLFTTAASAEIKRFDIPLDGSPSSGPRNAPVTIVEFVDYQ
jgi:hypothetical protein